MAHARVPAAPGAVRRTPRARRLWCRVRRHPDRPGQPRHRRQGDHRAPQPRAPRCDRRGARLRRRCRHPARHPRRLPARGRPRRRLRAAAGALLRRRHRVPPRRRGRGRQDPSPHRGDRGRGGPRRARLARGPGRLLHARRHRPVGDAHVQPAVRRRVVRPAGRDGARAARVLPAQAGRARDRRLLPVAVVADHRLQGHAHHRPARPLLPRPGRRARRLGGGRRALAVLHQHLPELAALAPVPLHRAQRRDQHRDGQPQLDAGP